MTINLETALSTWKHDGKVVTGQNPGKSQLGNVSSKPLSLENMVITYKSGNTE